jgi:hypothetical protein
MKSEHIVRYTSAEIKSHSDSDGNGIDWVRVNSITDAELDSLIASDPDDDGSDIPEETAVLGTVRLNLPLFLARELPAFGPERDREVSRIVAAHLKRKTTRPRKAG